MYTTCSRHVCYINQKARGSRRRAPARALLGNDFANMKTAWGQETRKKQWRKNDREGSKPNSPLRTFAESWMCHAIAEMPYWMRTEELLNTPLQSASENHCAWEPLWSDPAAALPGFHSAAELKNPPHYASHNTTSYTAFHPPPQYLLSAPSQINIINLPNPNDCPDL